MTGRSVPMDWRDTGHGSSRAGPSAGFRGLRRPLLSVRPQDQARRWWDLEILKHSATACENRESTRRRPSETRNRKRRLDVAEKSMIPGSGRSIWL